MALSKKQKIWWEAFVPRSLNGLTLWLDDPAIASNIIESALRISQWTDISGNGNHFVQTTGADQPLRTGSKIGFNGTNYWLDGSANVANFKDDLQGELIFVMNFDTASGAEFMFTLGDGSVSNRHLATTRPASGNMAILFNNLTFKEASGTDLDNTNTHILRYSSSGTAYRYVLDGVSFAIDLGVDNGDWFGDIVPTGAIDVLALGTLLRTGHAFGEVSLQSVLNYNRQLTSAEGLDLDRYLNNRFNIGLSL